MSYCVCRTDILGKGFAGYLRRFSVYPVKALWPTILPIIAMNRALTKPEPRENINGWTVSRYKFFYIATICMFFYYWLPGYLFTALSTFNWMTWIAPQNMTLAILTGSSLGLGLFNPLTTFDWNVATSSYAALSQPFFATCTMYFGGILGGCECYPLLGEFFQGGKRGREHTCPAGFSAWLLLNIAQKC